MYGKPSIARVYNHWLGGTDTSKADREAADQAVAAHPGLLADARANRAFGLRVVSFLAGEVGIRQFLDIGSGIPFRASTHDIALAHQPRARVVYVDNDPVVADRHRSRRRPAVTRFVPADVRDPDRILAEAGELLDFTKPVAILLVAILHLIPDSDDPYGIVRRLAGAAAPDSYLALSHLSRDLERAAMTELGSRPDALLPECRSYRTHAHVARFFDGMDLVPPGLVPVQRWRPDDPEDALHDVAVWGGVARRP
jgi:hypothetical protein